MLESSMLDRFIDIRVFKSSELAQFYQYGTVRSEPRSNAELLQFLSITLYLSL